MAIKAEFLDGVTEKRVSPLYQWDYGQTLEIESPDFSAIVEVHFGCPQLQEAIVHVCSVEDGVATVSIPDRCLEQSGTITAWIYEIEGTTGATTKVVYIPVVARTRPPRTHEIPEEVSDRYTELITEVNEVVGGLIEGEITVASAARATSADRATQASNASSAAYASSANTAMNALCDGSGKNISDTYVSFGDDFLLYESGQFIPAGTYQIRHITETSKHYAIITLLNGDYSGKYNAVLGFEKIDATNSELYTIGAIVSDSGCQLYAKKNLISDGVVYVYDSEGTIYYRKINNC